MIIKEGGIWEIEEFEIIKDYTLSDWDNTCKHVKDGKLKGVVVAKNEGGYNSTGVCCECLAQALSSLVSSENTDNSKNEIMSDKWINVNDEKPNVEPVDGLEGYYESRLVLVAFKDNKNIFYEVAKFTKKEDTAYAEFLEMWYIPQAEDVVVNVIAWMPFRLFD